jgi:hypothetical protein
MNEAVHNDSDDESHATNSLYMATSITSHSHFHWILDGGSTTHICKDISAFSKLAPTQGTIGSIQKKGPKLDIHRRGDIHVICSVKGRKLSPCVMSHIVLMPVITSFQRAEWTERDWRSTSVKAKSPLSKITAKW